MTLLVVGQSLLSSTSSTGDPRATFDKNTNGCTQSSGGLASRHRGGREKNLFAPIPHLEAHKQTQNKKAPSHRGCWLFVRFSPFH